jgi:phosphomannomutase
MKRYLFDVDGTLTPARQRIDPKFQDWFLDFAAKNSVYLVTGSDNPKTREQLGSAITFAVDAVFNCNGNETWDKNELVWANKWRLPEAAHEWLAEQLTASEFELRTGLHFEHRSGMVNFSIVGRNAEIDEREQYIQWDKRTNEREKLAVAFNLAFPALEARVGGDTGIDVTPRGSNKAQVIEYFNQDDDLIFFGDDMGQNGNDYPLYRAIVDEHRGFVYTVGNWTETWNLLQYGK